MICKANVATDNWFSYLGLNYKFDVLHLDKMAAQSNGKPIIIYESENNVRYFIKKVLSAYVERDKGSTYRLYVEFELPKEIYDNKVFYIVPEIKTDTIKLNKNDVNLYGYFSTLTPCDGYITPVAIKWVGYFPSRLRIGCGLNKTNKTRPTHFI